MTVMMCLVVRLHDEDWDAWGESWQAHVGEVGSLPWARGPYPGGPRRQLDWGAWLTEATEEEVSRCAWEPPWFADTESAAKQRAMLAALSPTERYGLIDVEMA